MARTILAEEQELAAGYVLGDLSEAELTEFEAALATDLDLQAEVDALQLAFHKVPQGLEIVVPPAALQAKLLSAFAEMPAPAVAPVAAPVAVPAATAPISRKVPTWGKALAGLGLLLAGWLAVDNFSLRQQLQVAQQVKQQDLANILNQPKSRLVSLNTAANQVSGNILFTPGKWQKVIVSARDLPPLPADEVYRMWLELANGQVIPCGEFRTNAQGSIFVQLNAKQNPPPGVKAKGVFVTIDKANAPLQPSGEKVLQGTI
jgi:Anti-sigma-K factor rskA